MPLASGLRAAAVSTPGTEIHKDEPASTKAGPLGLAWVGVIMNVLLTCVGRRRYLVEYLKSELNGTGMVLGVDNQRSAPAASVCDMFLLAPDVYAESYIDYLVDVCRTRQVAALLSLNDLELPLIAEHAHRFRDVGTVPVVSSAEVVRLCADKLMTARFAESIGVSVPRSYATL